MDVDHSPSPPIYKQQVLSHFHFLFHILDADGLRDFIILHSQYNLVQEGMQSKERYFVPHNQSIKDIPTNVQHLFICEYKEYRDRNLILSTNCFNQLTSITIGSHCFMNVGELVIDGLDSLESVIIGENCFGGYGDGICRITNCPNLTLLEIGNGSFKDFKSFELSNVNSLQSIEFGKHCFKHIREFVLDRMESLESVKIGRYCFRIDYRKKCDDGICRITNCPNLTLLEIGDGSFKDFKSFELSNLNSLQSIEFGHESLQYADLSLKGE